MEKEITPSAPVYDNDAEVKVKAGAGMAIDPEPTQVETKVEVEDTTLKTEVEAPQGGDAQRSSQQIAELGEDRKRLASELIELARESDVAASKVKELISADPRMEKLIKTKFGEDYDRIMEKKKETPIDVEAFKEQARVEARAEILVNEAELTKRKQFDLFATQSGVNSGEAELLREHAELLETKHGYEKALELSLMLVNRDKALASSQTVIPSGTELSDPPKKEVTVTPELEAYTKRYMPGRTPLDVAKGLQSVNDRITKEGDRHVFRLSTD